jgi:hypothetical protein
MTTNEMQLAKAFRENAGLEQDKAEKIATTIFDAIRDNVATKSDVTALGQSTKSDLASVKSDLELAIARLSGRVDTMRWMIGFNLIMTVAIVGKLFLK